MGQVIQLSSASLAPKKAHTEPTAAPTQSWTARQVPELSDEQRERLTHLVAEAQALPESDYYEMDTGQVEFEPRDFTRLNALHRSLGAPAVESLDVQSWRKTFMAIRVVVVPALRLLAESPSVVEEYRWQRYPESLIEYFEAVVSDGVGPQHWQFVSSEHQRVYGHLPLHGDA